MSPSSDVADSTQKQGDPMKIVHKEQDVIVSFCLNQVCFQVYVHVFRSSEK